MTKLPRGWKEDVFGSISRIANGQVDPKKFPYKEMIHIGPENIESDSGILSNLRTAEELGLISGKYEFDEHAIVYSKIRPNLNKLAIPGFRGICSADMYPIWPAAGIDRDYLFWIMRSQQFYSQAVACSTRTGLPKINRDGLSAISVLIPPLTEQKQIAALLNFWDKALNTLQKVVDVKREHKRALMQRLLTGKVRFPEFAGEPWFKLSADKIFKSHSKKGNTGEALLAVMQDIGVVPRDSLDRKVAMPEGDTHSYKLVEPGDFVISLRSFQGGIEYSMHRGIVSPAYTVLKSICSIEDAFYKHYFKSYDFIGHLAVAVIGIRDGKQVSYDDFSLLKLPYPSIEEQRKIAAVLSAADREINLLTQKLDAYKQQKKGLMQQLLTGKKRVNLENKEFA